MAAVCVACPPGSYSGSGDSACTQCEAGKANGIAGSDAAADCLDCAAGTYSAIGAADCTDCPAGKFSASAVEDCELCPDGTFSDAAGATECTACSEKSTSHVGSDRKTKCMCEAGTWGTFGSDGELSCTVRLSHQSQAHAKALQSSTISYSTCMFALERVEGKQTLKGCDLICMCH